MIVNLQVIVAKKYKEYLINLHLSRENSDTIRELNTLTIKKHLSNICANHEIAI